MNIVFFAHPDFLGNKSMDRFAKLLSEGMGKRGHSIQVWSPKPRAYKLSSKPFIKKWLSYVDLYILFPRQVRKLLKKTSPETLFVFTDQSLGMWVPLTVGRPTVVHCHDFLALRSALGEIQENPTGKSGRIYQRLILKGFSKAENFISVSSKTRDDLHQYALSVPKLSEVVYNGLHQRFSKLETVQARIAFGKIVGIDLEHGYLLHVGGNTWYKNRIGVVEIYEAWRKISSTSTPLLLIGAPMSADLEAKVSGCPYKSDIYCLTDINDNQLGIAYSGALLFLFPSLGEGFGWPIAEAMASGALVLTTDEAPMSEVAGAAGYLVQKRPANVEQVNAWASSVANTVEHIVTLTSDDRRIAIDLGLTNAKRFDTDISLDSIESFYYKVLQPHGNIIKDNDRLSSESGKRISSTVNQG